MNEMGRIMTTIALLGAGGKMGSRLAANLRGSPWSVAHVEVSEAGRARLHATLGVECVALDTALADADVVLMAVPDALIGKIIRPPGSIASRMAGRASTNSSASNTPRNSGPSERLPRSSPVAETLSNTR